jgi:hypothetical protein
LRIRLGSSIITTRTELSKDRDAKMNIRILQVVVAAALAAAGCSSSQPAPVSQPGCTPAPKAEAMPAARHVLVQMGFQIDKYDLDAGVITTRPLSGSQFFEVWRGDNASTYDATEAAMHSIRRVVEMSFTESDGSTCMLCRANVKRLSLPERQVVGTSGAFSLFTRSTGFITDTRLNPAQEREMAWIDLDRDAALEAKVVASVDKSLAGGRRQTK